jgi:hypothetical protein
VYPSNRHGSFANGSTQVGAPDGEETPGSREDGKFGFSLVEDAAVESIVELFFVLLPVILKCRPQKSLGFRFLTVPERQTKPRVIIRASQSSISFGVVPSLA